MFNLLRFGFTATAASSDKLGETRAKGTQATNKDMNSSNVSIVLCRHGWKHLTGCGMMMILGKYFAYHVKSLRLKKVRPL